MQSQCELLCGCWPPKDVVSDTVCWSQALSIKLKLKQAAIRALPLELRVEAEKDDDALPPMNRNMFTHTPPIPGYMDRRQEDTRQRSGRKIGTR